MTKEEILAEAVRTAEDMGLDKDLVLAFITVESDFNQFAVRFEPNWTYFYKLEPFASMNRISLMTEKTLQQFSYGLMQVMGSVLRELGFRGNFLEISSRPELGIYYGCVKLQSLLKKYENKEDALAAYNAGTPKKTPKGYLNQEYVDKIKEAYGQVRKP